MMFITAESPSPRPTAVAMGLFDGLHLGHQAVIRAAAACAPTSARPCSGWRTAFPFPSRDVFPTRKCPPPRRRVTGAR